MRGKPESYSTWVLDDVWAAASAEKAALDILAERLPGSEELAEVYMNRARLRLVGCYEEPDSDEGRKRLRELATDQGLHPPFQPPAKVRTFRPARPMTLRTAP